MYEFLQDENECLSKLLFLLFCSEISDKMVKQMTYHDYESQSPGEPLGWVEHLPGGREDEQTQGSYLQAGHEGHGVVIGWGNSE